jgi:uncharacterized damage-inducible protein DinB
MYRRISDFLSDHAAEIESTLKLFRAIPERAAGQAVVPGGRTLGRLAWHVTCSLGEVARSAKLGELDPHDDQAGEVPTMERTAAAYDRSARAFGELLKSGWTDPMLDEEIEMYGMRWKRGNALTMLITHQAHHRGQITVLMRQAGLEVPGTLGPSREEWAQWNMPAQK